MRTREKHRATQLKKLLTHIQRHGLDLPGIENVLRRDCFIEQIIESIRRVRYVKVIKARGVCSSRADPHSDLFDPIKAAIWHQGNGQLDDAFWMIFLSVHFGKNGKTGWRLARDVFGRLGRTPIWDWSAISTRPTEFRNWLAAKQHQLRHDGTPRHFGNHRKYQSLDARSDTGTGAAFESYVMWVGRQRSHVAMISTIEAQTGPSPKALFDGLYKSMRVVQSFGRTARFDYLTMLGKIGLAAIEPGSTYMTGATGPYQGAKLLLVRPGVEMTRREIEESLCRIDADLKVGMQVLEDALCNWQKSPDVFIPFRA